MKRFLAGVATTLLVLGVGLLALVWSMGHPTTLPGPPAQSAAPPTTRPSSLPADETWLGSMTLRSSELFSTRNDLRNVAVSGEGTRLTPEGIHGARLTVDATLPFPVAARQVGADVRLYAAGGGKVGISRTLSWLGRDVEVRAVGTVAVEGGQLVIQPEQVDTGAPGPIDAGLSEAARRALKIRQPVQGLPRGLSLTGVSVTEGGFAARLTGIDVTLAP